MTHILEADSIQLAKGDRRILSDIYLKCETGKITALMGRNGQGKSCLMKIIYGSMGNEKSVRIDGVSYPMALKRPDLLRYLPQFNFIPGSFSLARVFDDFALGYSSFAKRFPEFSRRQHSSVRDLSGGDRRLLEVYILLKSASLFVMLDEPFTHLSPVQIEKVQALLIEEKASKGLLISDHMYGQVLDIADTIYLLSDGKTHLVKNLRDIEDLGYALI